MATLYENYTAGSDGNANIATINWAAQTFTPSVSHILTSVKLYLSKVGSPGTITVSIRAVSGGVPTGSDIVTGTTDGDTLVGVECREITFSTGAIVLSGIEYAIVVRALSGVQWTDYLDWRRMQGNPYARGSRADSADNGVIWTAASDHDCLFEEWGEPQGSGAGGSIFPTEAITRVTNIIHRYNREEGVYTLEMALGEVTSDFGLPEWLSRPQPLNPLAEGVPYPEREVIPPTSRIPGVEFEPEYLGRIRAGLPPPPTPAPGELAPYVPPEPVTGPTAKVTAPQPPYPTITPRQEPPMTSRIPGVKFEPAYIGRIARQKLLAAVKRIIPFGGPGR